jgi:hypothetical protein
MVPLALDKPNMQTPIIYIYVVYKYIYVYIYMCVYV